MRVSAALAMPGTRVIGSGYRRALSKVLFVGGVMPLVLLFGAFGYLAYEGRQLPSSADIASLLHAAWMMLVAGCLLLIAACYERGRGRRMPGLLR
jgi:hypothetical protein